MITTLINSAFQNGYLSVESEGLIRQMLAAKLYKSVDLQALKQLDEAVQAGQIQREAKQALEVPIMSMTTDSKTS